MDFATDELAPLAEDGTACMADLEEVMCLFAFGDSAASPVSHLLEAAQRQKTASQLNRTILAGQSQDTAPRLHLLLKLLMWAQGVLNSDGKVFPRLDLAGNPDNGGGGESARERTSSGKRRSSSSQ